MNGEIILDSALQRIRSW